MTTIEKLHWREQHVLEGLADGLSYEEIARRLYLGHNTVKRYVTRLYKSLDVENALQAVSKGYRTGLLRIEEDAA